jgi:hypothetical protein
MAVYNNYFPILGVVLYQSDGFCSIRHKVGGQHELRRNGCKYFCFGLWRALLGTSIGTRLPRHHLDANTKDVVRLAMAMVGTMAAIALGLLTSSAYSYYSSQTDDLVHASADVVALGRLLQRYGPEANGARESLRMAAEKSLLELSSQQKLTEESNQIEAVYDQLEGLTPKDDTQRMMKSEALGLLTGMSQIRALMIERTSTTVLKPLLFVLIFWLVGIFLSWGLFSPRKATVVITFFVAALCVSSAIMLILDLYSPYRGLMHLSTTPLRLAYESLGQ